MLAITGFETVLNLGIHVTAKTNTAFEFVNIRVYKQLVLDMYTYLTCWTNVHSVPTAYCCIVNCLPSRNLVAE